MQITDSFLVPVEIDRAWAALLDVERVAPCMPGATLQSFDGDAFTGTVSVKLGALSMKYQGSGRFVERDVAARRVAFEATGRESRGSGTAAATVVATLSSEGEQTRVDVESTLNIGGRAAQFGRSVLNEVAGRLLGQFAAALAAELTASESATAETVVSEPASMPASVPAARVAEPIDLADIGRQMILKRAAAPAAVFVAALIALVLFRRRR